MATEVMEDRHDRGLEIMEEQTTEQDHGFIIVDEPVVPNPAPQLPITPSSKRPERAASRLFETSTPSQRRRNTHPRRPQDESRHAKPSKKERVKPRRQPEPHRPSENRANDREPPVSSPNSDRLGRIRQRIKLRNQDNVATATQTGAVSELSNERLAARPELAYIPLSLNPQANINRNWSAASPPNGPIRFWQPYFENGSPHSGGRQAQFVFPSIEH